MITNFDYLKDEPKFQSFADIAISAERIILMDPEACILNCRRAMEFALKWMYSVDSELEMPYQDSLQSLMNAEEYREIIGIDLWRRMDYIRRCGNNVAHSSRRQGRDEAMLCLENLFVYLDYIAYCYSDGYQERSFDVTIITDRIEKSKQAKALAEEKKTEAAAKEILRKEQEEARKAELEAQKARVVQQEISLAELVKENAALKEQLSARRQEQQETYVAKPLELSEYRTRKLYIDAMLQDAGWIKDKNWKDEVELVGMPNTSGVGYADYVLYDDTLRPLAVIEAKRTCVDVSKGRQQAKLYADLLEQKHGRRPVIFLTNGFETRIIDTQYPERKCSFIYSKRDLEKWFNLLTMRTSLRAISVDKNIAGRYYQEAAIKAVCDGMDQKNRRKSLVVMATGSGKTRTVIGLCDVLLKHGWVKNILFLADRNSLVTQAKRAFVNLLPNHSCTNLVEEKGNYDARIVFSTYQTMMNCIDTVRDDEGKLFTTGHFDLLICDEAHRSIYNKYQDIFNYFDAPIVGLTATPKDEIDRNTYSIFELEDGVPTYGYDLAQAVKDGYLVDYTSIETKFKFLDTGIVYEDLPEAEKEIYEATFADMENGMPDSIDTPALNSWVFNEDTIIRVLNILMERGIHIDYGQKIGKTIIFAKNHKHAEEILRIFHQQYPNYPNDYAKVIDNYIKYAQSAIDEFSDPKKLPQIAISVDMLDTGIDVPEVLNLVFFKKVMSKAKFWQMIGRGTRLCPDLLDGEDKKKFYIFDFCGNFEFFRMKGGKGEESGLQIPVQGAVFDLQFGISYKLQDLDYQVDHLIAYRNWLIDEMTGKVHDLPRDNFAVKQHLKYVELYSSKDNYNGVTYADTLIVRTELSPLIQPSADDAAAVRFDALLFGIELAQLIGNKYTRARTDLIRKVKELSKYATIPEVKREQEFISTLLHTNYIDCANTEEWEEIRKRLRELMKYIPRGGVVYYTNFEDQFLSEEWQESDLEDQSLQNYKAKAEYYVRQHKDNIAIAKLRTNRPLTREDVDALEAILWQEIGTKQDYEAEYGTKPLGEFVREIVGLDMNAAKEAFSDFLNGTTMDSRQIYFVNQIVEYIVRNGMMKDLSVLQESPFTDQGSVVEIFTDLSVWQGIRKVIDEINTNAVA